MLHHIILYQPAIQHDGELYRKIEEPTTTMHQQTSYKSKMSELVIPVRGVQIANKHHASNRAKIMSAI
jgi:hypothetical protein